MQALLSQRLRPLNHHTYKGGPVLYWLSRDQRTWDNWALLQAQQLALDYQAPWPSCSPWSLGFSRPPIGNTISCSGVSKDRGQAGTV